MTPNLLAYGALIAWPVVAVWLFRSRPVGLALVWTILGGYLMLPVGTEIKLPSVPVFDKSSIPNLCALIGCVLAAGRWPKLFSGFGVVELLVLGFVLGPFITSQLNGDTIVIGELVLPGVGLYDALSAAVGQFIFLLPFFLGRQFLRHPNSTTDILRALVAAGLVYSIPMLLEVRLSPQLHTWIYGYFPHSFGQQMRDGGFRPVVFLGHGLLVAFFIMTTTVAAAALWRMRISVTRVPPPAIAAYLAVMLILCKTLGALVYGAILVPLVRFASPRLQVRVAMIFATIALTYPLLRATDLVPAQALLEAARSVSEDRAASLNVRLVNEERLLAHASQKLWFGWGRFGRSRVYDEYGNDISLTDGYWIITLGTFGLMGFLAEFLLLAVPIYRAASALRRTASSSDAIALTALSLIVAISMIDLLPNASISTWTWLLAGALLGQAESVTAAARRHNLMQGRNVQYGA
jgi:hypothetical protein